MFGQTLILKDGRVLYSGATHAVLKSDILRELYRGVPAYHEKKGTPLAGTQMSSEFKVQVQSKKTCRTGALTLNFERPRQAQGRLEPWTATP